MTIRPYSSRNSTTSSISIWTARKMFFGIRTEALFPHFFTTARMIRHLYKSASQTVSRSFGRVSTLYQHRTLCAAALTTKFEVGHQQGQRQHRNPKHQPVYNERLQRPRLQIPQKERNHA